MFDKFVSIFFLNLDEFYMIRVSGLKEQIRANIITSTIDGLTPFEELRAIEKQVKKMLSTVNDLWNKTILPDLKKNNIGISKIEDLTKKYCSSRVLPEESVIRNVMG